MRKQDLCHARTMEVQILSDFVGGILDKCTIMWAVSQQSPSSRLLTRSDTNRVNSTATDDWKLENEDLGAYEETGFLMTLLISYFLTILDI